MEIGCLAQNECVNFRAAYLRTRTTCSCGCTLFVRPWVLGVCCSCSKLYVVTVGMPLRCQGPTGYLRLILVGSYHFIMRGSTLITPYLSNVTIPRRVVSV